MAKEATFINKTLQRVSTTAPLRKSGLRQTEHKHVSSLQHSFPAFLGVEKMPASGVTNDSCRFVFCGVHELLALVPLAFRTGDSVECIDDAGCGEMSGLALIATFSRLLVIPARLASSSTLTDSSTILHYYRQHEVVCELPPSQGWTHSSSKCGIYDACTCVGRWLQRALAFVLNAS